MKKLLLSLLVVCTFGTSFAQNDTLTEFFTGTIALSGVNGGGYLSGNNVYGDAAKGQRFDASMGITGNGNLTGVLIAIPAKTEDGGGTFDVVVREFNAAGPSLGATLATETIQMSAVDTNLAAFAVAEGTVFYNHAVTFGTPVPVTNLSDIFIDVVLPTTAGDTIGIMHNTDGDFPNAIDYTFETWAAPGSEFYDINTAWGIDIALCIFPIINFIEPVTSITVQGAGGVDVITVDNGTLQMEATVLPANATDGTYTWSVADGTGSAIIDAAGLLTAVSDGTVTVTATANDGSGVTGDAVITISNQVTNVLVSSITVQGTGGVDVITTNAGTLQMEATVLPANATIQTYTWSVADGTGSATIDAAGLLTAVTDGTVTVTATANDGSGVSGDAVITISNQDIEVATITVQGAGGVSIIDVLAGTLQMEATVLPANATDGTYTWSVADGTGSATIDAAGLLTAVSNGTVTVTATANDGSGVSGDAVITISNQDQGINDVATFTSSVYPNPTNNVLNINASIEMTSVKVISIDGKVIFQTLVNAKSTVVNVESLNAGMYFYEINASNGTVVRNTFVKK